MGCLISGCGDQIFARLLFLQLHFYAFLGGLYLLTFEHRWYIRALMRVLSSPEFAECP